MSGCNEPAATGATGDERAPLQALRPLEGHLVDTIFDSVLGVIYLYDEEGRFLRWNQNFLAVSGYTAQELAGMRPLDFFRGDDVARVREAIRRVFDCGESAIEAGFVAKDGRVVPYYFTGKRITLDGVPCLVGMGSDITARVEAEASLRRSEQRYHSTLDSIMEGCQLIGYDWRYLYLNDAASRHNRRPNAELLGKTMTEAWPGIERTPVYALLRRCLADRVAGFDEVEFSFADGSRAMFEVRAQPVPEGVFVLSIDVTDRHRAEKDLIGAKAGIEETNRALKEEITERRRIADIQTAILDALPAHIALIDGDGQILEVNESWRRFSVANVLGSPDYGVGASYLEVCEQATGDCSSGAGAAASGIRRVLSGELAQFALEYPCHAPDERRWFRLMVTPLQTHGQAGAVVMHVNVTERHLAQEALEHSVAEQRDLAFRLEAQRASLAEAQAVAHVGSWDTDLTTGTVAWSDETHRLFGTDPSEFHPTHRAFLGRVHPDDRAMVDAAFTTSFATETDHAIDHRVCLPDGRVTFVQERWRVIHDISGAPLRAAGTCQDITDRKQAEETLRESEERFRQLAETISEVFWITDAEKTRLIYVSPAYESIWGRPREQLYAHPERWVDAIHPEDRDVVRQALPRQCEGDYDITYRVVRPDHSLRWVRDRAFPVRDGAGTVYRVVGLAEDITERKGIEAQFLRAQRMESIGTLAGGIAHDLNNVLTPILMSVELLKGEDTPEGRRQTLDIVEASARKGAEMIGQVLTFARGVEGKRVEVGVPALLRDVSRIANDTFLKTIAVTYTTQEGLPPVLGDSTQLHQVLLNLCVNARDAMPAGGTIELAATCEQVAAAYAAAHTNARPGAFVAISVTDTGTGMPAEVIERIFEPFYSTKALGKGTGLGLSTSLAIVKSHGGFFHVESTPGVGSAFVFYLPIAKETACDTDGPDGPAPLRGNGEVILVVDDEQRIRDVTRRMLETFGYRVLLAADGAEAVEAFTLHHQQIGAVLTDMMMPVMDGAATIRALRALDPAVRIVSVSGLAPGDGLPADTQGAITHTRQLSKPYTAEELLRVIHAALHDPP